jgi:dihydrofolate synthase/folylpolyglutamate synthase
MNYREAIDFLFRSLPMYQRVGKAAYKANLDNTLRLDEYFGHPHLKYPAIHVAGTNGKGSVSHMMASILQEAGFRTGLYTSPHLLDFRERIRVSGLPIPEKVVTSFVNGHRDIIREISPSFFEMTVAMAFDHFAREKVDIAVIETGMGGRLDSTNVISPLLCIITNISRDHTEFLGGDLDSIAREKGGIIKKGVPLVLGEMERSPGQVLSGMAAEKDAPVTLARNLFRPVFHTYSPDGTSIIRMQDPSSGTVETIECGLGGNYQQENLATALSAVACLRELGWDLPGTAVKEGLKSVVKNTGILGRWQLLGSNPRSICDTGHNRAGIEAVFRQVMEIPWKELHVVWGMVSDKDPGSILPLLPRRAGYYFTRSSVPRAMDPDLLLEAAAKHGLSGRVFPSVKEAYDAARERAGSDDMILTCGSTFVVADLLLALGY